MSDIDKMINEFELLEKESIKEFDNRIESIENDEIKNILTILRDIIMVEAILLTLRSAENLTHIRNSSKDLDEFLFNQIKKFYEYLEPMKEIIDREKTFKDKYL